MTKEHPLKAIRRAGVPLAAFETADPTQTIKNCIAALNGEAEAAPIVTWDIQNGQAARNAKGKALVAKWGDEPLVDPAMFLKTVETSCRKVSGRSGDAVAYEASDAIIFVHNGHLYWGNAQVLQGLWNLRDALAAVGGTLIVLAPTAMLPAEVQHDMVVVTEPLATVEELAAIVDTIVKDAGLPDKKVGDRAKIVDTLLGLSAFAAEQAFAMSITKDGVNRDTLWERKRKMVEQTPGLTVYRDSDSFDMIGGCDNVKNYVTRVMRSKTCPVRCIGFIDEIEKMLAGAAGDLSGVSQDQLGVLLREMQDSNIPGMIFIGPPGTAKSAVAKAAGSVVGAEVLSIDTGAMTGSLVGESQGMIRKAMATFKAVAQGKGFFIATCNKIASLPPELRRRFTLGTFFFDLPDKAERDAIWKIWMAKFKIDVDTMRPDDEGWTGAEIKACCEGAWRTGTNLIQASEFIVPVSRSAADQVQALRQMASGKFVSASKSGVYQADEATAAPTGRKVKLTHTMVAEDITQQEQE